MMEVLLMLRGEILSVLIYLLQLAVLSNMDDSGNDMVTLAVWMLV